VKLWLATFLALAASSIIGAVIGINSCSRWNKCPRYLQRQLAKWHGVVERQNAQIRRGRDIVRIPTPIESPDEPDEAA